MTHQITFGSVCSGIVCSGIEAASVAWNPLGWKAAWLAEIEPFPCALLAHHYPDVPNLGNMLQIPALLRNGAIPPPDVFTGGTPCQAFSLAGLRNSLNDARGNLSLTFCEIANEIDIQRAARGLLPATVIWENVPGVLSTQDNAFGYFLAGLAGEDDPLVPPGKRWPDAGCVYGPQRAVAWRILDAQYFGLAQRRRRVFVVASARNGFDPARVLFEFEGVLRDTAPRRETGQDTAGTLASRTDGGGFPGTDEACSGYIQPVQCFGGGNTSGSLDIAACLTAKGQRIDFEVETFAVQQRPVAHAFDARQSDVIQYGDFTGPLDTCGSTIGILTSTSYAIQAGALRENPNSGPDGVGVQPDIAYTLEARAEVQAVAFSCKDYGADASVELAPTMRAMGHSGSHANAGGQLAVCVTGDITHTLKAEGFDASEDGTGRGQPIIAFQTRGSNLDVGDIAGTIGTNADRASGSAPMAQYGMAVRRLTPMECERLQGFKDNYTLVPVRGKPAADGPRYKSLGNSWAVPVVSWIGARVDQHLRDIQ